MAWALALAGCGGNGSPTAPGGSAPLELQILQPAPASIQPTGQAPLELDWNPDAPAPDSFEVLIDGQPTTFELKLGLGAPIAASGSFELIKAGPQELEVRAIKGGLVIDSQSRLLFGELAGLPPFPGIGASTVMVSELPSGTFGQSGSRLGDLDGDGHAEVTIGDFAASVLGPTGGRIQVRSTADGTPSFDFSGLSASELGLGVSWMPDQDGDGLPDILVGAPQDNTAGPHAGAVFLISSQTGSPLLSLFGKDPEEHLGNSLCATGDINGDGREDILVGGAKSNVAGFASGRVTVFSGADGSRLLVIDGEAPVVQLGIAVDAFGDQDGDGVDDLLVGEWGATDKGGSSGAAIVFSGRTGEQLLRIPGEVEDDHFGIDLCGFPDIDNDGIPEILTGAWEADPNGISNAGAAYVHSGRDGHLIHRFQGESEEDRFGTQVACAGDLNGDLIPDALVSAPFTGGARGTVYLFSGATGERLAQVSGAAPLALFGAGLESLGDVDGDGWPEFFVGAPIEVYDQQPFGAVRIFGRADRTAPLTEKSPSWQTDLGLDAAAQQTLGRALKSSWPLIDIESALREARR